MVAVLQVGNCVLVKNNKKARVEKIGNFNVKVHYIVTAVTELVDPDRCWEVPTIK